uniref:Endonuclease/exonuclease/phosphatase domain-containing protein n=1 Tax=Periophthalmus magnuspinnatus TaxID=409849 RepID=A0A3B4ALZ9_9GOBI
SFNESHKKNPLLWQWWDLNPRLQRDWSLNPNKIFTHLAKLQPDICVLQEAHLSNVQNNKLLATQFNKLFSANYNTKPRSVSMLINKNITFTHIITIKDPEGRFVIINMDLCDVTFRE